ncbi:MAG: hypothetical protein ACWGQW_15645 [bacterium]
MASFKDKIKKMKGELRKAHEEEQQRKPPSMYGSVFKAPNDLPVNKWRCDDGDHEIDIIPFIGTKDHPQHPDKIAYSVDLYVHKNIGPGNDHFVCPKTYGEPCPICEYLSANYPVGSELFSKIKSQERSIYLVWVHDTDEEEKKGIQIWDVAKFFFGEYLKKLSAATRRGGGATIWSEIDETGKSIAWTVKQVGEGKVQYYAHRFVDRTDPIPDWILGQVTFQLDDLIKLKPTYDEIAESFYNKPPSLPDASDKEEIVKSADSDCPEGGTIGKDFKQFDNCNECPIWDECSDEFDKLKPEKKPEPEPPKKETKEAPLRRRRVRK